MEPSLAAGLCLPASSLPPLLLLASLARVGSAAVNARLCCGFAVWLKADFGLPARLLHRPDTQSSCFPASSAAPPVATDQETAASVAASADCVTASVSAMPWSPGMAGPSLLSPKLSDRCWHSTAEVLVQAGMHCWCETLGAPLLAAGPPVTGTGRTCNRHSLQPL